MRRNILSITQDRKWNLFVEITKLLQKDKAPIGPQEQQEPIQMAVDSTARHFDRHVEIYSCTTYVKNLLFTHSDAFTLSWDDIMNLSLAFSLASLENTSGPAAVINSSHEYSRSRIWGSAL